MSGVRVPEALPDAGRLAVIGDIGGHLEPLLAELTRLGVPEGGEGPIPPDLTIIQVGDLVHRGPASAAVVQLVDRHLRADPDRWIQLVGNHEAHYLRRRKQFSWPEKLPAETISLLRDWWSTGRLRAAVAVRSQDEEYVVTHGGVTRGFWRDVLGGPPGAVVAAQRINALAGKDDKALFRFGTLVGDREPEPLVGPVWAAAGSELVASWLGHDLPFNQVHGHTSVYEWDAQRWHVDPAVRRMTTRDLARQARHGRPARRPADRHRPGPAGPRPGRVAVPGAGRQSASPTRLRCRLTARHLAVGD